MPLILSCTRIALMKLLVATTRTGARRVILAVCGRHVHAEQEGQSTCFTGEMICYIP